VPVSDQLEGAHFPWWCWKAIFPGWFYSSVGQVEKIVRSVSPLLDRTPLSSIPGTWHPWCAKAPLQEAANYSSYGYRKAKGLATVAKKNPGIKVVLIAEHNESSS